MRLQAFLCLVVMSVAVSSCRSSVTVGERPQPLTVIIVRHAEKAVSNDSDPPLSEAGRERAARLAAMLASSSADALYASDRRRAVETLEPLSRALALPVTTHPAADTDALVRQLSRRRGVVVVAGHSNTIEPIIRGLGGPPISPIAETDYDNLFVVTLAGGVTSIVPLKY